MTNEERHKWADKWMDELSKQMNILPEKYVYEDEIGYPGDRPEDREEREKLTTALHDQQVGTDKEYEEQQARNP